MRLLVRVTLCYLVVNMAKLKVSKKNGAAMLSEKRRIASTAGLAMVFDVSPQYISMIISKRRKPSLALALRMQAYLGIPVESWS